MGLEMKKYFKLPPKFGLNISVVYVLFDWYFVGNGKIKDEQKCNLQSLYVNSVKNWQFDKVRQPVNFDRLPSGQWYCKHLL